MSREYEDPADLPRWAKMALVEHVMLGENLETAAKHRGKSRSQLQKYSSSPAGKKWKAEITKIADDPVKLAEMMIRSSIHSVTAEYLAALDTAIQAGDYKEVGVMSRDMLDRMGVTKKKDDVREQKTAIVINLQTTSLDVPTIRSTYQLEGGDDAEDQGSLSGTDGDGVYWSVEGSDGSSEEDVDGTTI